jgi:glucose-6-phosphate dehydrogenase assembly protein OpcA
MTTIAEGPRPTHLSTLERELMRPWRHPGVPASEVPATRALLANLVVVCDDEQHAAVSRDVAEIVAKHPSRVIVLVVEPNRETSDIPASVTTHGRLATGSPQVCGDVVTLHVGPATVRQLPSLVWSLLLGELPTALWWGTPQAASLACDAFDELAGSADQVILDSAGAADPLSEMLITARWIVADKPDVVSDLAWRRPKLWRRIVAQALDPEVAPGALESIENVQIAHGPSSLTGAWLLTGWLAFRLGWRPRGGRALAGGDVAWTFESPQGTPRVQIRRVPEPDEDIDQIRIATKVSGRPVTFNFARQRAGHVSVVADGLNDRVSSLSLPVASRGELVARQLPDLSRDGLFESSIILARSMAEAVV